MSLCLECICYTLLNFCDKNPLYSIFDYNGTFLFIMSTHACILCAIKDVLFIFVENLVIYYIVLILLLMQEQHVLEEKIHQKKSDQ